MSELYRVMPKSARDRWGKGDRRRRRVARLWSFTKWSIPILLTVLGIVLPLVFK